MTLPLSAKGPRGGGQEHQDSLEGMEPGISEAPVWGAPDVCPTELTGQLEEKRGEALTRTTKPTDTAGGGGKHRPIAGVTTDFRKCLLMEEPKISCTSKIF